MAKIKLICGEDEDIYLAKYKDTEGTGDGRRDVVKSIGITAKSFAEAEEFMMNFLSGYYEGGTSIGSLDDIPENIRKSTLYIPKKQFILIEKVRYIGIDTPEKDKCFFKEASEANAKLVQGKKVKIVKDVSEVDEYGRLLRYIYVDDIFVNDYLVRNGFARAKNFPPDEKLKDQLKEAELEARENKRGMWAEDACKSNAN